MRRFSIRHVLAALAWLGLTLAPLAPPSAAMAMPMEIAAGVETASIDMPDGMPCCPETQQKPDCAKDCPFMALCAGKLLSGIPNGAGIAAPLSFAAHVLPGEVAKLSGFAQAPPPRPPKA